VGGGGVVVGGGGGGGGRGGGGGNRSLFILPKKGANLLPLLNFPLRQSSLKGENLRRTNFQKEKNNPRRKYLRGRKRGRLRLSILGRPFSKKSGPADCGKKERRRGRMPISIREKREIEGNARSISMRALRIGRLGDYSLKEKTY